MCSLHKGWLGLEHELYHPLLDDPCYYIPPPVMCINQVLRLVTWDARDKDVTGKKIINKIIPNFSLMYQRWFIFLSDDLQGKSWPSVLSLWTLAGHVHSGCSESLSAEWGGGGETERSKKGEDRVKRLFMQSNNWIFGLQEHDCCSTKGWKTSDNSVICTVLTSLYSFGNIIYIHKVKIWRTVSQFHTLNWP